MEAVVHSIINLECTACLYSKNHCCIKNSTRVHTHVNVGGGDLVISSAILLEYKHTKLLIQTYCTKHSSISTPSLMFLYCGDTSTSTYMYIQ